MDSTAGSRIWSRSEFQTVGPATENARVPKVLQRTQGTDSLWLLADQEFRRLAHSSRWGRPTLELGAYNNTGLSQQATHRWGIPQLRYSSASTVYKLAVWLVITSQTVILIFHIPCQCLCKWQTHGRYLHDRQTVSSGTLNHTQPTRQFFLRDTNSWAWTENK